MTQHPAVGASLRERSSRLDRIAGIAILVVSLVTISGITLAPAGEGTRLPFWCFHCGTRPAIDVLLNVLMFVPLGAGLALLGVRARWAVAFVVGATLTIELLQFIAIPGRFASARDILTNTIGGLLGWRVAVRWRSLVAPSAQRASTLSVLTLSIWLLSQAVTAWAMHVVMPPAPWWAQIRLRDLGFPAVFDGQVIGSSLGTVAIRYSDQLEDSEAVRRELGDGASMTTVVTGVAPSAGAAPILLLAAQDRLSEIAALVQTGTDVFFRMRTRAAVLGFRNPSVRLAEAFPRSRTSDTISVTGRYANGVYSISSLQGSVHRTRRLAASPSWMWALLIPVPHYSFGAEVRLLTGLWLFVWLGLAGTWAAQSTRPMAARDDAPGGAEDAAIPAGTVVRRPHPALRALAVPSGAIIVGLGAIPPIFGLPVSHWSEWIAAVAGVATGWMLGRLMAHAQRDVTPAVAGPT